VDPNLVRWLVSSILLYFGNGITIPVFNEGHNRRTDDLKDYCEVRYTGPRIIELSHRYWDIQLDVDVLVVNKTNDKDLYTLERNVGQVLSLFNTDIAVMKYGDDPNIQVGCFRCGPVTVNHFGEIKHPHRLRQASLEATYQLNLTT
jgi:hypothetical protein